MRACLRRCARIAACAAALAGLTARPGPAQSDPRLAAALSQAREGAGDSARATIARLLAATPRTDTLYPQILYVSALTASTAQEMQRSLQRITVEHPLSSWADDALLTLAQLEYASGNLPGTVRNLERLRSDYPRSPVLGSAAFWAARAYFDMRDTKAACVWIGAGLGGLRPEEQEVRAQLEFFAQRCPATLLAQGSASRASAAGPEPRSTPAAPITGRDTSAAPRETPVLPRDTAPAPRIPAAAPRDSAVAAVRDTAIVPPGGVAARDTVLLSRDSARVIRDSAIALRDSTPTTVIGAPAQRDTALAPVRRDSTPVRPGAGPLVARVITSRPAPRAAAPAFRIQVVAANTQQMADAAVARLRTLGFESRVVPEGGFLKVRAGPFASRADVQTAMRRIRADFPGAFTVADR